MPTAAARNEAAERHRGEPDDSGSECIGSRAGEAGTVNSGELGVPMPGTQQDGWGRDRLAACEGGGCGH